MQIKFWGTRGSIAKPGPATIRYGGNTSCIEVRSAAGTLIVIDCGTGAHGLGQALVSESEGGRVDGHLLVSHTHWDHIQGLPFFAPLSDSGNEWHIYGPRGLDASIRETLVGQMQYTYFPVTMENLGAEIHYHDLVEGSFDIGDVRVVAQYLNHPALTLGYRLEADGVSVVYACDHEPHVRELAGGGDLSSSEGDAHHVAFLQDADLVIHDTQYQADEYAKKIGWGHSTVEYAIAAARSANVSRLAITHYDPLRDDDAADAFLERAREHARSVGYTGEVFAAMEGASLKIEATGAPRNDPAPGLARAIQVPALETVNPVVLIGVDDATYADVVSAAAKAEDLRLLQAAHAGEALELARAEHPGLCLLSCDLAGGGALDVCRALRTDASSSDGVKVIAIAADGDQERRREGREAGIADWLVWPFTQAYLRTKLRAWMLRIASRWEKAPLPQDEARRLRALHTLGILDTEPEERFDRLTREASARLDVPVALVSLVDFDRQWFKSRHGVDATETPRDQAFCAHAILDGGVFQVIDALRDPRFADNPLVKNDPGVRFYAGVPLELPDGSRAGTLCVIDNRPRALSAEQLDTLRVLGKQVERELACGPASPDEKAESS
jgi:phosphoribosyl 1,2-cyclic phosphodiesterase/DNA-binding response OmpR family regulator